MRTRRRPVLQDKTPGNTPQKPQGKGRAKPKLVPVVELTLRPRRGKKVVKDVEDESMDVDKNGERC